VEAQGSDQQLFSQAQLIESLAEAQSGALFAASHRWITAILAKVEQFAGGAEPADDIAILVTRFLGSASAWFG
jgi:serine phosphatase RsbU (regulator of sigma subunit)